MGVLKNANLNSGAGGDACFGVPERDSAPNSSTADAIRQAGEKRIFAMGGKGAGTFQRVPA